MPTLTREQSRAVDRFAMETLGIPGLVLMENAARGIAACARTLLASRQDPVAIVCGPGNNGGDGLAAARHLANAGVPVRIHLTVPPDAYAAGSDSAVHLEIARRMGLEFAPPLDWGDAALILDGVFGTGLAREVRSPFREAIEAINRSGLDVLAVDLPSGLDADTGHVLGVAVRARATATMVAPKRGFRLARGPELVGRVTVVDIGVPPSAVDRIAAQEPPDAR